MVAMAQFLAMLWLALLALDLAAALWRPRRAASRATRASALPMR